jgi:TonB family protein
MYYLFTSLVLHISLIILIFWSPVAVVGDQEEDLAPMTVTFEIQGEETQANVNPEVTLSEEKQEVIQLKEEVKKTSKPKQQSKAQSQHTAGTRDVQTDRVHASWKHRVKPNYPPEALTKYHTGLVVITVHVNTLGYPIKASITTSSGSTYLDNAALKAAMSSLYFPRSIHNITHPDIISIPYHFDIIKK